MNLVHLKGIGITNEHIFLLFCFEYTLCTCSCTVGKKHIPFSIAIGNVELMNECFPNTCAWKQQE